MRLVFVLSSHEEGLGLVFLEAMSCGLPIVATATEGAREVFKRGAVGSLVPTFTGGSRAMTEAIMDWSTKASQTDHRGRARCVAEREFSDHIAIGRFVSAYRDLLAKERP